MTTFLKNANRNTGTNKCSSSLQLASLIFNYLNAGSCVRSRGCIIWLRYPRGIVCGFHTSSATHLHGLVLHGSPVRSGGLVLSLHVLLLAHSVVHVFTGGFSLVVHGSEH